jgi:thiol-disulfide isomerase/thioredoxin
MLFRFFLFLSFFSVCTYAQVTVAPLFGGEERLELKDKTLRNKVVMFFKSDCSACRTQVKDLSCLKKNQVLFFGFSSDLKSLQKEARLMGLDDRVYYAPKKVTRAFGLKKDYSPVLFAFNREGKSKSWLGKQNCKVFVSYLAEGKTRD